jgi:hypothetical protein
VNNEEAAKANSLESIPAEEIKVEPKSSGTKSKIGDDAFVSEFVKLIKSGPVWRSSGKLAEILQVDVVNLAAWMDKQPEIARRPGKEDGVVYYAALRRLEEEKEKIPPGMERKQIIEEDRYAFALLHQSYNNLTTTLEKYALGIHTRNKESFAKLVEARDAMSAGIVLFANALKLDISKLPK